MSDVDELALVQFPEEVSGGVFRFGSPRPKDDLGHSPNSQEALEQHRMLAMAESLKGDSFLRTNVGPMSTACCGTATLRKPGCVAFTSERRRWTNRYVDDAVEQEFVVFSSSHRTRAVVCCAIGATLIVLGTAVHVTTGDTPMPPASIVLYAISTVGFVLMAVQMTRLSAQFNASQAASTRNDSGHDDRHEDSSSRANSRAQRSRGAHGCVARNILEQQDACGATVTGSAASDATRSDACWRAPFRSNARWHERCACVGLVCCFIFAVGNFSAKDCDTAAYEARYGEEGAFRNCRGVVQTDASFLLATVVPASLMPVRFVYLCTIYVLCTIAYFASKALPVIMIDIVPETFWTSVLVMGTEIAVCIVARYRHEMETRSMFETYLQHHAKTLEAQEIRRATEWMVSAYVPLQAARHQVLHAKASGGGPLPTGLARASSFGGMFAWSKRALLCTMRVEGFAQWTSTRSALDVVELVQNLFLVMDTTRELFDPPPPRYHSFGDAYVVMLVDVTDGAAAVEAARSLLRFAMMCVARGEEYLRDECAAVRFAMAEGYGCGDAEREQNAAMPVAVVGAVDMGAGGGVFSHVTKTLCPVGPVTAPSAALAFLRSCVAARMRDMSASVPDGLCGGVACTVAVAALARGGEAPSADVTDTLLAVDADAAFSDASLTIRPLDAAPGTAPPAPLYPPRSDAPRARNPLKPRSGHTVPSMITDADDHERRPRVMLAIVGPAKAARAPSLLAQTLSMRVGAGIARRESERSAVAGSSLPDGAMTQFGSTSDTTPVTPASGSHGGLEGSRAPRSATWSSAVPADDGSLEPLRSPIVASPAPIATEECDADEAHEPRFAADRRVALERTCWCSCMYRFCDPETEATFVRDYRDAISTGDHLLSVALTCASLVALVGVCFVDDNYALTSPAHDPLPWSVVGVVVGVASWVLVRLTDARGVPVPRLVHVLLSHAVQALYLASVGAATVAPRISQIGDSQVMWLFVMLHWSINRPVWAHPLLMVSRDVVVFVFFVQRTYLHSPEGGTMLYYYMECAFICVIVALRLLNELSKRQRFAMERQLEYLAQGLEVDYRRLRESLDRMVPHGIAGELSQRARRANQAKLSHGWNMATDLRPLRVYGIMSNSFATSLKETPFLVVEIHTAMAVWSKHPEGMPEREACALSVEHSLAAMDGIDQLCRDGYGGRLQCVKALLRTALICGTRGASSGARDGGGPDGSAADAAAKAPHDRMMALDVVMLAVQAMRGMLPMRCRMLLHSGPIVGAVVGSRCLSFEYYGSHVQFAMDALQHQEWGSITATSRLVELCRQNDRAAMLMPSLSAPWPMRIKHYPAVDVHHVTM